MYNTILYRSKNIYTSQYIIIIRLFSLYIYSDTTVTGFFLHGSTEQQTSGRPWNQKEKNKKKWEKTHLSFRSAEITTTQKYPKKNCKKRKGGEKEKQNGSADLISFQIFVVTVPVLNPRYCYVSKGGKNKTKQLMNNIPCI